MLFLSCDLILLQYVLIVCYDLFTFRLNYFIQNTLEERSIQTEIITPLHIENSHLTQLYLKIDSHGFS
jgi:hypothetical protein